jgi:hypothetical protein
VRVRAGTACISSLRSLGIRQGWRDAVLGVTFRRRVHRLGREHHRDWLFRQRRLSKSGGPVGAGRTLVINYSLGHAPSLANGAVVKGCYPDRSVDECVASLEKDITVGALGSPTHVIIDVVGYLPN